MDIKSSKAVNVLEAREILVKRNEEGELGYEQAQALEHSEKFCKNDPEKMKTILANLQKNEKIGSELATKIIDIAPTNVATLKAVLLKDKVELSEEELNDIVKQF
ncbi:hypothetical protein KKF81_03850 [Candidatus Micrarchaeota archaeon]|nr:hypothetical protein [Candidatus Micrarchaeota archaeon]MBU1166059.1 hypothetical protein [Candidatus Micrarchaeota archaeon]MBU1886878.1 hypothetical protein [Candidatus Micrarchaeota archaeon]